MSLGETPPSQEIWSNALRIIEQSVQPSVMKRWISPLHIDKADTGWDGKYTVVLEADAEFSAGWVRDQHLDVIRGALEQVTGRACEVVIRERLQAAARDGRDPDALARSAPGPSAHGVVLATGSAAEVEPPAYRMPEFEAPQRARSSSAQTFGVDPRYTFDSFVVGASNQFAHASAIAVAEAPARQYNPLLIYSNPGLGKTHLLHAIANHVLTKNPNTRVAYLSAEGFVNELIDAIQHKAMSQFRTKYRDSYDLILIDDIQFIAGKDRSEEEFFHTFNALYSSKRQIIMTSDRPPKEIDRLEERLRTRLEWGLVADIQPPEIETRIAILKSKAEREDIYLPDDVASFLATYIKGNVRELEGVLVKLQAQSSLSGAEISLEMVKRELRGLAPQDGGQYTVESIQAAVAKHFRIKVQDLRSPSRARAVAFPRQIAIYLIRKYTGMGFEKLGSFFGGRDHSTTLHACRKIELGLDSDIEIRDAVEAIQNLL